MKQFIKGSILIMIFAFTATTGYAQKRLTFSTVKLPTIEIYEEFIKQAYLQIGIEVEIKQFPGERALKLANEGNTDGEVLRISGITKLYPNLIQIPTKVVFFYYHAYSKNKDLKVNGMKSLKLLKIGIYRGDKIAGALIKGMKTQMVNNPSAQFGILKKDRVDIILGLRTIADAFLRSHPEFSMIHRIDPPLFEVPFFHYLHKKNQHLISKIQPILEKMVADKVLDKIRSKRKIR